MNKQIKQLFYVIVILLNLRYQTHTKIHLKAGIKHI